MWSEPYLETCCRAALHRLKLSGAHGRPDGLKDGPCLARIAAMGFAEWRHERFVLTDPGARRHAAEIAHPTHRQDASASRF